MCRTIEKVSVYYVGNCFRFPVAVKEFCFCQHCLYYITIPSNTQLHCNPENKRVGTIGVYIITHKHRMGIEMKKMKRGKKIKPENRVCES